MAFTIIPNIDTATHATAILELKTRLKAAGWTIEDSGDGEVNIGAADGLYGAGADVLSVASTSGSYVAGNIANRLAWWRIRSPLGIGGPELVFYHAFFNSGSDSFGGLLIPECAGSGPWPGATSAHYGNIPTTNLVIPFGSSNSPGSHLISNQYAQEFDGDGATARKMDFAIGDADEGYAWYAFTRTAARRNWRGWALDFIKPATRRPEDAHGYVLWMLGMGSPTDYWLSHLGSARTVWGPYSGHNALGENAGNPSNFATDEGNPLVDEAAWANRRGRVSHCILDPTITGQGTGGQGTDLGLNPYNSQADVWRGSCWYWRSGYAEDFTGRGSPRYPGLKGKSTLFHHGGGGVANCAVAAGQGLIAMGTGRVWAVWDASVPLDPGDTAITASVNVNMHTFLDVTYNDMTITIPDELPANTFASAGELEPEMITLSGAASSVINRVWDTVAGSFVSWESGEPDTLGVSYPGPGTFGADTADFCIVRD
jgi:hypothetical protein